MLHKEDMKIRMYRRPAILASYFLCRTLLLIRYRVTQKNGNF